MYQNLAIFAETRLGYSFARVASASLDAYVYGAAARKRGGRKKLTKSIKRNI